MILIDDRAIVVPGHFWIDRGVVGGLAHLVVGLTPEHGTRTAGRALCGVDLEGEARRACRISRACARCHDKAGRV